ncbi:Transmembrane protease serine 11B-like protein like [Argiope bruennichi]|uniref:Transmembrane protease serine 11B-like protein like n=1 Tax=Argiope bruennichi TaxID=94029 RepID=A0A8T0ETY4_ARGBR|nr:Transmembrane protease serine 11B-like protein like [Argiope bruennichi]
MFWSLLKLLILTAYALVAVGRRVHYENQKISQCPPQDYSCCVITHCPAAWTLFNAGIQPKICGWSYRTPLVCCPRYIHQEQLHDDDDLFPSEDETPATEEGSQDSGEEAPPSIEQKSAPVDAVNIQPDIESKPLKVSLTSAGNCGIREVDPSSDIPESAIRNIDDVTPDPSERTEIVVVGGTPVNQKWSWMAGIYNRNAQRPFCGGTVIDDMHILTAAHCFDPRGLNTSQYTVKIGEVDLMASNPSYEIDEIKAHENYQPGLYYDDIALIRLKERVPNDAIAICVPEEDNLKHGDNVTVLGWGQLSFGGRSTRTLQEAR